MVFSLQPKKKLYVIMDNLINRNKLYHIIYYLLVLTIFFSSISNKCEAKGHLSA